MQELEKNVMCVLLQALRDKDLITQDIHHKAKTKILNTLEVPEFFCNAAKEGRNGHTQDSC